jgi:hypothetical protein
MTTDPDFLRLFKVDPEAPRLVGVGIGAWVALDTESKSDIVTIGTTLVDLITTKQTDTRLLITFSSRDAILLAKAILSHVDAKAWKEHGQGDVTLDEMSSRKKLH